MTFGTSPGGLPDKNPLANAGAPGSVPGPGRSHMSRNTSTTKVSAPRARAPQQEESL